MQYENTQKSMYLSDDFLTVCAGWLGKQEGTSIEMSCSRNIFREQIGLTSLKGSTYVYLVVFNHKEIIFKYVSLVKQHQGTFTQLVRSCLEQLQGSPITHVKVESVTTTQMRSWCLKHGMHTAAWEQPTEDGLCISYVAKTDELLSSL